MAGFAEYPLYDFPQLCLAASEPTNVKTMDHDLATVVQRVPFSPLFKFVALERTVLKTMGRGVDLC